jgi:hypothetical protein
MTSRRFRGMVSSDWSECLSPNGPFDPFSFSYPALKSPLDNIFKWYTGNRMSLKAAVGQIMGLLPEQFTPYHMDEYLDAEFAVYKGVTDLMRWCDAHDVLFMLNTTGTTGYFQRAGAKGLLPKIPAIASNPMIAFPGEYGDLFSGFIHEISDKPVCTKEVATRYGIDPSRIVIIGDSGGDGPHFGWGSDVGAFLIGSMTKSSLLNYCEAGGIIINQKFGPEGGPKGANARGVETDFMELCGVIEGVMSK